MPIDDHWHGTASALLAAGTRSGVAKNARVINVRALVPDGFGTWDDAIRAIDWVTEQALAKPAESHVANFSIWGLGKYPQFDDALRRSVAAGVAWSISAGNANGASACDYIAASLGRSTSGVITVGAMNALTGAVAPYSNQGPCVEIFAPSDYPLGPGLLDDRIVGGTSAAAPLVAGTLALRMGTALMSPGEAEGLIKGAATVDAVTNLAPNTTNLLLYSILGKRRAAGS
ncbi:MAG TPA: S8 family serine peptidase [Thermoanaerobaculia bacterium]